MKIKIKGILADERGKALRARTIRGCIYNKGKLALIASSKSAANGSFTLSPLTDFADSPLPRLALQIFHKNKWLMLTDQLKSFTRGVADFSKVLFHETPLYKVGTVPYYGDNHTVTVSTPLVVRNLEQPIRVVAPIGTPTATTSSVNLASITKLNTEVSSLKKQKLDLTRERDSFKTELARDRNSLRAKDKEITRIRADLQKTHKLDLSAKENVIKKLQEENKELKKGTPDRVNIDEIALSTGSQIEDVQRRLSESNSSMRLSKVSLHMKGIADPSGKAMVLPPKKDIAGLSGSLSALNLDFSPRIAGKPKPPETLKESTPQKVGSYIGLTKVAASRQLETESLSYRFYNQPLKEGDTQNLGRVIHQSPTEGSLVDENTTLKLIIGKA